MRFTTEHEEIRRTVRRFCETEVVPHIEDWEEAGEIPLHQLFKRLGAASLLGINKPERFGGMGLDYSYHAVFIEEFCRNLTAGAPAMSLSIQTDMCTPALAMHGSDSLRDEFLAPAIAGDSVGCIAVTEPSAGSDVAAIRTHARSDGEEYIVSGAKTYISSGSQADWMCCLVNTGDGAPHKNKSLLIIPMDNRGISTRKLRKLGMWGSDTAEIFLDEVRVPKRHRIGDEGAGFAVQMEQFQEERLVVGLYTLGLLDRVVALTLEYTRERHVFGQSLLDNQSVHYRMAELVTEIEVLRSLVYRAIEEYDLGGNITRLASMVKLKTGRVAREVTDSCLQYFGGQGYMWEAPIGRLWRDLRLISIGGGADEVMLRVIAKIEGFAPKQRRA